MRNASLREFQYCRYAWALCNILALGLVPYSMNNCRAQRYCVVTKFHYSLRKISMVQSSKGQVICLAGRA